MDCKNTRRLSVIAAAVAMCLLLCACAQEQPPATEPTQTQPVQTTAPTLETEDTQPAQTTAPTQETEDTVPPATYVTVPQIEASYEQWLAATMMFPVYQQYLDVVPLGVYTLTESTLSDYSASQGVFIHFRSGSEEVIIRSVPLTAERTESGTTDLYSAKLGYATFDRVVMNPEELMMMTQLDMDGVMALIEYTGLVYLYSH